MIQAICEARICVGNIFYWTNFLAGTDLDKLLNASFLRLEEQARTARTKNSL